MNELSDRPDYHGSLHPSPAARQPQNFSQATAANAGILGTMTVNTIVGLGDKDLNLWAANELVKGMQEVLRQRDLLRNHPQAAVLVSGIEIFDREIARFDKAIKILRNA